MKANFPFIFQALLAALFFGASAPISKLLLGEVPPVLMAAFLYLGSGTGITLAKLSQRMTSKQKEAGLGGPDMGCLVGAFIAGGIFPPPRRFAGMAGAHACGNQGGAKPDRRRTGARHRRLRLDRPL